MYKDVYSPEISKKLAKLKKKDPQHYVKVIKKRDKILAEPRVWDKNNALAHP